MGEFCEFITKGNGVKHTLITPYHPRSNGLVELFRSVQTLKQFFKAGDATQLSVARFFFSHWTKQNSRADQTPAEFFLSRGLNSRLDLLGPDEGGKGFDKEGDQKKGMDKGSKEREFIIWEQVLVFFF